MSKSEKISRTRAEHCTLQRRYQCARARPIFLHLPPEISIFPRASPSIARSHSLRRSSRAFFLRRSLGCSSSRAFPFFSPSPTELSPSPPLHHQRCWRSPRASDPRTHPRYTYSRTLVVKMAAAAYTTCVHCSIHSPGHTLQSRPRLGERDRAVYPLSRAIVAFVLFLERKPRVVLTTVSAARPVYIFVSLIFRRGLG